MSHAADADYTSANEPNMDELMPMLESAMAVAEEVNGRGRRWRRNDWEPFPGLPVVADDTVPVGEIRIVSKPPMMPPQITRIANIGPPIAEVTYTEGLFEEAKAKAAAERAQLSTMDSLMVNARVAVIEDNIRRLRELKAAEDNAILQHALTTLELGCLGLHKVTEPNVNDDALTDRGNP